MNRRIVRGSAWIGLGMGVGQLVALGSMLVLVRLLDPASFGIVAVGVALLAVVAQVQESGLGAAVVQGRHRDPRTAAASAFVFATVAGFAFAGLVVALAPIYTTLIRLPEATPYVQALAAVVAIRGLAVVPGALLERELDFRSRTKAELSGFVVQALVAVSCAAAGLGAWSLVGGQIAGTAAQGALMWAFAPYWPAPREASIPVLREMLRYGRHVSGANVLVIVNNSMDNVVVGRFLGAAPLGAYSVALRLASLPNVVIGSIVGRIMFSVYARVQHDVAAVRAGYVQNLQRTVLLALPVTVALGIGAEPIVLGLLGARWEEVIGPLRILALFGLIRLVVGPSGELFKGIGRPHLALLSAVLHFCVVLPALLVLVPRFGTSGAAFALVLAVATVAAVMMPLTLRAIELRPVELVRALARPAACGAIVAVALAVVVPLTNGLPPVVSMLVVVLVGGGAFLVAAAALARAVLRPIVAGLRGAPDPARVDIVPSA
ncbi:MAG: lipopolysaccharide biosynthesis protein [Actinomycetota bacterium]